MYVIVIISDNILGPIIIPKTDSQFSGNEYYYDDDDDEWTISALAALIGNSQKLKNLIFIINSQIPDFHRALFNKGAHFHSPSQLQPEWYFNFPLHRLSKLFKLQLTRSLLFLLWPHQHKRSFGV